MLYFKALLEGLSHCPLPIPPFVPELRKGCPPRLAGAAATSWVRIDPVAGARIHPNDPLSD
ncbi:hypothetical protein ACLK2C_22300 [Escherichia coli]